MYNKTQPCKVSSLMSFDQYIQICESHHPQSAHISLSSQPLLPPSVHPWPRQLQVYFYHFSLSFEFYINEMELPICSLSSIRFCFDIYFLLECVQTCEEALTSSLRQGFRLPDEQGRVHQCLLLLILEEPLELVACQWISFSVFFGHNQVALCFVVY